MARVLVSKRLVEYDVVQIDHQQNDASSCLTLADNNVISAGSFDDACEHFGIPLAVVLVGHVEGALLAEVQAQNVLNVRLLELLGWQHRTTRGNRGSAWHLRRDIAGIAGDGPLRNAGITHLIDKMNRGTLWLYIKLDYLLVISFA